MKTYDLIVIGGGPAGYSAALEGVRLGGKVALLEKELLGGTCLNRGCIPTKTLLESVKVLEQLRCAEEYGICAVSPAAEDSAGQIGAARNGGTLNSGTLKGAVLNRTALLGRKRAVTEKLRAGLEFLLADAGVDVIEGRGTLLGEGRVRVETEGTTWGGEGGAERGAVIFGEKIIIAAGSREAPLRIQGAEYLTGSAQALELERMPADVCIVGGGVVGMEFAAFYSGAGCRVRVLEALPGILNVEDREMAGLLSKFLRSRGVEIDTGCRVQFVEWRGAGETEVGADAEENGFTVRYECGGENRSLKTDMVLNAVGRRPVTEGLGLEECGVCLTSDGYIRVNEYLQTTVPEIYAAGDVTGPPLLAHAAFDRGIAAAQNALTGNHRKPGYKTIPRCIYTHPEFGAAGVTEEEAKEKGIRYRKGYCPLSANGRALAAGKSEGMVKLIAEAELGQIIGVHILGECAAELTAAAVCAVEGEFTCEELAGAVLPHPTIGEALKEAAADCLKKLSR